MTTIEQKIFFGLAALALAGACTKAPKPTGPAASDTSVLRAAFTAGVTAYLEERGDLCVDRAAWPVDVSEADMNRGTRDARQLPVLERLGVVEGVAGVAHHDGQAVTVRRYRLTALGRRSFIDRRSRQPIEPEDHDQTRADLCVARLSLDAVKSWELRPDDQHATSATVAYTYAVDAPAWIRDAEAQRAFPAVGRVLAGARTATLAEGFTLVGGTWIADELVPANSNGAAIARATGTRP
ncbi:MAG TPA: hypothetical protein VHJ20_21425 [Polyangia bacterium]|nr:hypothetical protein [Polyangia bacterium]